MSFGRGDCDFCPALVNRGYVKSLFHSSAHDDEQEAIYHAGPFNLLSLEGIRQILGDEHRSFPNLESLPNDIKYIIFSETHWLAKHDENSVLQFPNGAYHGKFMFHVEDPTAFDISAAKPIFYAYQSPQSAPQFLWFSEEKTDSYRPSNAELSSIILTAFCKGNSSNTEECEGGL